LVILVVGFSFSLAANLLWCWPGGPVRILGGALASVALPAAVHMWPHVPAHTWPRRAGRALVMTGIAAGAAATTFAHASQLLIQHGEDWRLALVYPAITELLVVFAVLAHRVPAVVAATRVKPAEKRGVREPAPSTTPAPAGPAPATPAAAPRSITAERATHTERVDWLRGRPEAPFSEEIAALRTHFRVSESTAKRIRRTARRAA
jgi:hypothetical protein